MAGCSVPDAVDRIEDIEVPFGKPPKLISDLKEASFAIARPAKSNKEIAVIRQRKDCKKTVRFEV